MPHGTTDILIDSPCLYLFIGPGDSGKSFAATSWGLKSKLYGGTDDRPAYMLEMDGRIRALRGRPIVYDSFTNAEGAIGVLNRTHELRENTLKYKRAPFHTLIIDSFTSFNDLSIADSLDVTEHKREAGQAVGRARGDLTLMTIEDYGYEAEAVRKLLWEDLQDLKPYCDIIVIAHEVEKYKSVKTKPGEPTRTELEGYKILARDKIAARIPIKFDEIYHFMPKEVIHSTHSIRRTVVFQDMMARSGHPQLCQTTAPYDISGKEFYPFWKELISK